MLQIAENPFIEVLVRESRFYYKEFVEFVAKHDQKPYLTNPGLHLKGKIVLETFCFMVPGILSVVEEIEIPSKNITYGGVLKGIPNWLSVAQDRQDITYFFNEQWGNKPAFTEMNPVEFVRTGLGVMKFIEVTSLIQTINLIKTFFTLDVALAPTSLYSELFNFTVLFRSKFKASTIRKDERASYKFRNRLIEDKFFLSDVTNNLFPSFFAEELDGTSLGDIETEIKELDSNTDDAYRYLAGNEKAISDSIMNVENMIQECIRTTENVTKTEIKDEALMREEKVENIPRQILELNAKVDGLVQKDGAAIEQVSLTMLQGELPVILSALATSQAQEDIKKAVAEGANRKLIIDTGKTFFFNMLKGINKQVSGIDVNDLNRLPKDIMLQVNLINNTSKLNLQILKSHLSLSIMQLTKLGASSAKIPQVEEYIKIRNEKASEMFMSYIRTPMQQIEILRAKGERLIAEGTVSKNIQQTLKQMFGEFSQTSKMMATQFSQVQTHLTAVTELLEDNKLQLSGLTPQIEQNIRQQFEGFEIKFSNSMSSEIGKITSLLSAVQIRTETSFERFGNDMINLSKGMQIVLSSLTSISRQIEELTNTAQIIQGLTETSVAKQDYILTKLEEFINAVAQKGLEGIYTTKITSLEDLKKTFTQNQKSFEESRLDQQRNVTSMENVLVKIKDSFNNAEDKVLAALNADKWNVVGESAAKIPARLEYLEKALNLESIERSAMNVSKIKNVLDNGLDMEGILKKINTEQEKLKTLRFNIPTEELENKINAEKARIRNLEFGIPTQEIEAKIAAEKARISRITGDMPDTSALERVMGSEKDKINNMIQNRKAFSNEMADEISKLSQMDSSMLALSRTIKNRDIVKIVEEMTTGILKNIELLNPYFKNTKGVSIMEKLNGLEENMRNVINTMVTSGGSGGGDDKRIIDDKNREITYLRQRKEEDDEQISMLKEKMEAMTLNVRSLGNVIKRLLNEIYSFFLAETKFQNSIVRELMNSKVLTSRKYTQAIMKQIQTNHVQKLKSLFRAIESKIPVEALNNRNEVDATFVDVMKYAEEKYGPNITPQNDVEFNWWEDYFTGDTFKKVPPTRTPAPAPTPQFDWDRNDNKMFKI